MASLPTHTQDEDLVKTLMQEMDDLQENRGKRKLDLMLESSAASRLQNKALMAMAEEAHRRVDEQFDELERLLLLRVREIRQRLAARKVAMGATAPYLMVAANAHHNRVLRLKLERQRATARRALMQATAHAGSANAGALTGFMQELYTQIEDEIDMLTQHGLSFTEQKAAEQTQALESRRHAEQIKLGEAWRESCEVASGAVGMLAEVRGRVETRFEAERENLRVE